jgi:hypothetical protein
MTANLDPYKVRYPPESWIEILNEASVTTGGQIVAEYQCSPHMLFIENPFVEFIANLDMVIGIDGSAEVEKLRADAQTINDVDWHRLVATNSASVMLRMSTGGPTANVYSGWNLTVRDPTVADKSMFGIDMDAADMAILKDPKRSLEANLAFNLIPRHPSLLFDDTFKMFDDIIEYSYDLGAVAANSNTFVGPELHCHPEEVWCLLGVRIHSTHFLGVFSDSFVCIDRDNDSELMKLDASGMVDMFTYRCYMPFTNKMQMRIESITGSGGNNIYAGFIIGRRKATVIDHLRWKENFKYKNPIDEASAEKLLAQHPEIISMVKAGVV